MQSPPGFAALADQYDGFVLDLWGVIHDGVTPYPGAVDCLRRLRAAGKRVVLLSNAPRRAHVAQEAMRGMGIPDDLYHGILTSGEATHLLLRDRSDPFLAGLGNRVFHLGPQRDRNVLAGLDLLLTDIPEEADFVLNTGPDDLGDATDLAFWEVPQQRLAAASLKMICANPDLEVIRGGVRVLCAGALAQRYEALGGQVRWIGKPDPSIYAPVLGLLSLPPRGSWPSATRCARTLPAPPPSASMPAGCSAACPPRSGPATQHSAPPPQRAPASPRSPAWPPLSGSIDAASAQQRKCLAGLILLRGGHIRDLRQARASLHKIAIPLEILLRQTSLCIKQPSSSHL